MTTIDMKMSAIYQASHDELPRQAAEFGAYADNITGSIEPIVQQIVLAGNHPIGDDLADISVELFLHLRSTVRTCNDTATGLDGMADDFVRVDDDARAWFAKHKQYVGDPDTAPVPTSPEV